MAVAGDNGLVVPVVKNAQDKTLSAIAAETRDLVERAKVGRLQPAEYNGGTFSISNLGMFEVDSFTAIVNPPETCILAVGRIADRAVVINGQIVSRPIMNLCLSYDHRIIDGAPAARFLQCIKHYLENPVWLLM
jgi:pyruvate dehydrogenase E2 component (dihydrolipoamide acetyltransferase)